MSMQQAVIRRCDCKRPHKDGVYVVRFIHLRNRREWACRLCPHFANLSDAIAHAKHMRIVRAIGEALTFAKYNEGRAS